MAIKIAILTAGAVIPHYATEGSAGFDFKTLEEIVLHPGERVLVPTGLAMEIPTGKQLEIRSRSGLASKQGVIVLNSPGTVDCDYRGEIKILLCNISGGVTSLQAGASIAQGIITEATQVEFEEVESLSETVRGEGGFGSTDTPVVTPVAEVIPEVTPKTESIEPEVEKTETEKPKEAEPKKTTKKS